MELQDDDDIRLQRSSQSYIREVTVLLDRTLWKREWDDRGERQVHRLVRTQNLDRIIQLASASCTQSYTF